MVRYSIVPESLDPPKDESTVSLTQICSNLYGFYGEESYVQILDIFDGQTALPTLAADGTTNNAASIPPMKNDSAGLGLSNNAPRNKLPEEVERKRTRPHQIEASRKRRRTPRDRRKRNTIRQCTNQQLSIGAICGSYHKVCSSRYCLEGRCAPMA